MSCRQPRRDDEREQGEGEPDPEFPVSLDREWIRLHDEARRTAREQRRPVRARRRDGSGRLEQGPRGW